MSRAKVNGSMKTTECVRYLGPGFERATRNHIDPDLHLPGFSTEAMTETLCGSVDTMARQDRVEAVPTCGSCIAIAQKVFARYTAAQVRGWQIT